MDKKLVLLFSVAFSVPATANLVLEPQKTSSPGQVSQYGSFVIQTILKDMGLELSEKDKNATIDEEQSKEDTPSPTEKDKAQNKGNSSDVYSGMSNIMKDFQKDYRNIVDTWTEDYNAVTAEWGMAKKYYMNHRKQYTDENDETENTIPKDKSDINDLPLPPGEDPLDSMNAGDFYVIPNAMDIDIRDQKERGTGIAFTGIRAIETVLGQHQRFSPKELDLSEQHFYWLSKPDCVDAPCNQIEHTESAYFDTGFLNSLKMKSTGYIRQELYCPYSPKLNKNNLTHSPLSQQCMNERGALFEVTEINQHLSFNEIISELTQNKPIAAGFTLTDSYVETNGVVRQNDAINQTTHARTFARGHAMLLVGFIKLPDTMHAKEGRYCAIAANSWGQGYGVGGFACLTEAWMQANRFTLKSDPTKSLMTSVSKVTYLND